MVYAVAPGATQTTNGTPNTENDAFFIKPGATRNVALQGVYVQGRAASLTSISGLSFRGKRWGTTASSAGTAITPMPKDPGMQAAKATAAFSATTLTSGTGGPLLFASFGCGAAGPGGYTAPNLDIMQVLEAAATMSLDLFNVSGLASAVFECWAEIVE
jgi:hypothetical protein